jgi:hypothetical protein
VKFERQFRGHVFLRHRRTKNTLPATAPVSSVLARPTRHIACTFSKSGECGERGGMRSEQQRKPRLQMTTAIRSDSGSARQLPEPVKSGNCITLNAARILRPATRRVKGECQSSRRPRRLLTRPQRVWSRRA